MSVEVMPIEVSIVVDIDHALVNFLDVHFLCDLLDPLQVSLLIDFTRVSYKGLDVSQESVEGTDRSLALFGLLQFEELLLSLTEQVKADQFSSLSHVNQALLILLEDLLLKSLEGVILIDIDLDHQLSVLLVVFVVIPETILEQEELSLISAELVLRIDVGE